MKKILFAFLIVLGTIACSDPVAQCRREDVRAFIEFEESRENIENLRRIYLIPQGYRYMGIDLDFELKSEVSMSTLYRWRLAFVNGLDRIVIRKICYYDADASGLFTIKTERRFYSKGKLKDYKFEFRGVDDEFSEDDYSALTEEQNILMDRARKLMPLK